jgi:hypothetical protein
MNLLTRLWYSIDPYPVGWRAWTRIIVIESLACYALILLLELIF